MVCSDNFYHENGMEYVCDNHNHMIKLDSGTNFYANKVYSKEFFN